MVVPHQGEVRTLWEVEDCSIRSSVLRVVRIVRIVGMFGIGRNSPGQRKAKNRKDIRHTDEAFPALYMRRPPFLIHVKATLPYSCEGHLASFM